VGVGAKKGLRPGGGCRNVMALGRQIPMCGNSSSLEFGRQSLREPKGCGVPPLRFDHAAHGGQNYF